MDVVIVGSLAIDKIHTPSGVANEVLGGSALYAGLSAAKFCSVGVVGVLGVDRADDILEFLEKAGIDTRGVEVKPGNTFFWEGKYFEDINQRQTLQLDLGVFADFKPQIPSDYCSPKVLFLANIDPLLQIELLEHTNADLIALDTMDHWIENKKEELVDILQKIDLLIVNESEVKLLMDERNLVKAAKMLLKRMHEDSAVIVKKGEHGAMYFSRDRIYLAPAYPLEEPVDPTGAGDSFAGAFLGFWAAKGLDKLCLDEAMFWASAVASFCVEDFGPNKLAQIRKDEVAERVEELYRIICRRWESNPHVQTDTWS